MKNYGIEYYRRYQDTGNGALITESYGELVYTERVLGPFLQPFEATIFFDHLRHSATISGSPEILNFAETQLDGINSLPEIDRALLIRQLSLII